MQRAISSPACASRATIGGIDRQLVAVGEALEGGVEIERRVGQLGPAGQHLAMLHLLAAQSRRLLELGIVVKTLQRYFA